MYRRPWHNVARWLQREWVGLSVPGVIGAALFGSMAFTPSLLPRTWELQGIVAGISAGIGYALGVLLRWLIHGFVGRVPSARTAARIRRVVGVAACLLLIVAIRQGWQWQADIRRIMGWTPPGPWEWLWLTLLGLAVMRVIIALARGLRALYLLIDSHLRERMPQRIAAPVAALLVMALVVGVNDGLLWRGAVDGVDWVAGNLNNTTAPGVSRSLWPERSGSPASFIPWDTLGLEGRTFIAGAPTTSQLTRFSRRPSKRPIRIYVGIKSADSTEARVDLAVRDLRRAGGFKRAVLVVITTAGTGWVDPAAARSLEYMYNGNTAMVALQYSYIPSVMSYLVDRERALEAGAALFDAVYDAWSALPRSSRPRLLVTGTSLGAFGAEGAFSGLADMRNRTDGVLLVGPPATSRIHAALVADRDPGSLERLPVYQGGRVVRFGQRTSDWARSPSPWTSPRVLYVQNDSDPIVVWRPSLAFTRPDWLHEPPPADVLPQMRWFPIVTFWQITADLLFSRDVTSGHGHNYENTFPSAWEAIAAPTGWKHADSLRLSRLLAGRPTGKANGGR